MFSRVMERELKRKAESWLDEGTDEALRPRQAPKTSLSAVVAKPFANPNMACSETPTFIN